jgi:hypothetical protein
MKWFRSKQVCADCHFFVKQSSEATLLIGSEERDRTRQGKLEWFPDHYALCCHMGVWDEGVGARVEDRPQTIAGTNRRDFCFFWKYHDAMLLPAARVLQEREAAARKTSTDRRLTAISLVLAAAALIINPLFRLAEAWHWWPFPPK